MVLDMEEAEREPIWIGTLFGREIQHAVSLEKNDV